MFSPITNSAGTSGADSCASSQVKPTATISGPVGLSGANPEYRPMPRNDQAMISVRTASRPGWFWWSLVATTKAITTPSTTPTAARPIKARRGRSQLAGTHRADCLVGFNREVAGGIASCPSDAGE